MTDIPAGALVVCWPELFGVGLVAPKRRAVAVPGRPDSAVVARDVAPLAMASALLWLRDRGLLTLALDSARGFRRPAVRVSATAPVRLDERPPQRPLPHEGPEPMAYVSVRPNQKARDVVSNWIRSSDRTGDDGALFVILRGAA
ncbi:MAG: hypothetical protein QOF57_862, partial [Frankiaceae bacterium]|nr:hypothetical protein [Frankiaceae bacterium]